MNLRFEIIKNVQLRRALKRLALAADVYAANQDGATDPRCGIVQPVSTAEAIELNEASKAAWEILKRK